MDKSFILEPYVKNYNPMKNFTWGSPKMNLNLKPKITTRKIALLAIFSALFYVLSLIAPVQIPTTVGLIEISFAALIASIFGLVLGPYLGAGAALLGSLVTWALTGMSPYGAPFIIAPMFNALITGFIFYKKWKFALVVFAIMIVAFLFTPPVSPLTQNWYIAVAVLFDKVVAIALILPLAFFGKKMSVGYGAAFFFLLAFVGNQADNMWGSLAFATSPVYNGIFGMPLEAVQASFLLSPFLYPAIRLIQAFIAMVIAVPLLKMLKGTPWLWSKENILNDAEKTGIINHELAP
jgi:hypothetical protein